jgi:hypothetical protein
VSSADLEAVRRVAPRALHVVAQQPLLTIRFMRVVRGRPPNPERALVLVSNVPQQAGASEPLKQ